MGCSGSKAVQEPAPAKKHKKSNGDKPKKPHRQRSNSDACSVGSAFSVDDAMNNSVHGLSKRQKLVWHREDMAVTEVYKIIEIVGQGSMGEVTIVEKKKSSLQKVTNTAVNKGIIASSSAENLLALAVNQENSKKTNEKKSRKYACKTVNTLRMKDEEIQEFLNEIDILRDLDHPNIVQLFEVFRKRRKLWIVTELCTGGDLTSRMDTITEADVSIVTEQILRAVAYMHRRNVVHRDIKLENVMYANPTNHAPIKLIDFGLSNKFTKGEKMLKACGTIYAAAPELLLGQGYTEQADIWSIGVVTFVLLSQNYPFLRELDELMDVEKRTKMANAQFTFGKEWNERKISTYARDFVSRCLRKQPSSRCSAKEGLEYVQTKWIPHMENLESIAEATAEESEAEKDVSTHSARSTKRMESFSSVRKRTRMDSSMLQGMNKFVLYGELKKTILMTMAYGMDKSSLHELSQIFVSLDVEGDGTITLVDLKNALEKMHSEKALDEATIEKLFYGIDSDNTGQIQYNEFLAAVLESQGLITMEHLAETFDRMDKNGKGYISKDDLKDLLGSDYNEETVNKMIDEADFKKNGQVDYDEFLSLMFADPAAGMDVMGNTTLTRNTDMIEQLGLITPSGVVSIDEEDQKKPVENATASKQAVAPPEGDEPVQF